MSQATEETAEPLQVRVERSPVGRAAISGLILAVGLALLSSNLPGSELRRVVTDLIRPARDLVGLEQTWSVFAPNPRASILAMEARLTYADGSERTWRIPRGDKIIAPYRTYRWHKWSEWARSDDHRILWRPLAEWLARTQLVEGRPPVTVTLVRTWEDLVAPGSDEPPPPQREYEYFTMQTAGTEGGDR